MRVFNWGQTTYWCNASFSHTTMLTLLHVLVNIRSTVRMTRSCYFCKNFCCLLFKSFWHVIFGPNVIKKPTHLHLGIHKHFFLFSPSIPHGFIMLVNPYRKGSLLLNNCNLWPHRFCTTWFDSHVSEVWWPAWSLCHTRAAARMAGHIAIYDFGRDCSDPDLHYASYGSLETLHCWCSKVDYILRK